MCRIGQEINKYKLYRSVEINTVEVQCQVLKLQRGRFCLHNTNK